MKRLSIFIISSLAILISTSSCEKKDELSIKYSGDTVNKNGATVYIDIKSNTSWSVSASEEWVSEITPAKGNNNAKVNLTIDENNGIDRDVTITVVAGSITKSLKIAQHGSYYLNLEEDILFFEESNNTNATIVIDTNIPDEEWSVEPSENWIKVETTNNTISVNVDEYTGESGTRRFGNLVFSSSRLNQKSTIFISQASFIDYDYEESIVNYIGDAFENNMSLFNIEIARWSETNNTILEVVLSGFYELVSFEEFKLKNGVFQFEGQYKINSFYSGTIDDPSSTVSIEKNGNIYNALIEEGYVIIDEIDSEKYKILVLGAGTELDTQTPITDIYIRYVGKIGYKKGSDI